MRKPIALWPGILLLVFANSGWAQKPDKYYAEAYGLFGRRNSLPGTNALALGGEFMYKGFAWGADVATTVGNQDDRITIGSVGGSYHVLCCRYKRKLEPFFGAGFSYLAGNINAHGRIFPNDPGNDRAGPYFNQGLTVWPTKHLGARFEVREYRMFVSYGALAQVIPGRGFVEVRIGVTVR